MSNETATQAVLTLLACYPNTKADEKFVKMAAMALEHYSNATLRAMIDPKDGIVNDHHYMPSISQMRDFCKSYTTAPQPPRYVSFPEPEPASPESKAKIDSILATMPWANSGQAVKPTEEELQALKDKYATLPPPKFSEQALGAFNSQREFEQKFGKRPKN